MSLAEVLLIHVSGPSCEHSAAAAAAAGGPRASEGHHGNKPTTGQTATPARDYCRWSDVVTALQGDAVTACIIQGSSAQQQVKVHDRCARSWFLYVRFGLKHHQPALT